MVELCERECVCLCVHAYVHALLCVMAAKQLLLFLFVCVGSMDSQKSELIMVKLSMHDPWVPTIFFSPKINLIILPLKGV